MLKFEQSASCVCVQCRKVIEGKRDSSGKTKVKCPYCGTVTVSRVVGRRHVQFDVYAPQGQFFGCRE